MTFTKDGEFDGFSTATLQSIHVQPGVTLSFASGHAYDVRTIGATAVPEPASAALCCRPGRRRRAAQAPPPRSSSVSKELTCPHALPRLRPSSSAELQALKTLRAGR